MAYVSNDSGRSEVLVRRFASPSDGPTSEPETVSVFVSRRHGTAMGGWWQRAVLHSGGWHRHGGRCEHRRENLGRCAPCSLSDSPLTRRLGRRFRRISFSDCDACRPRHVSSVHDLVEPFGWPSRPTWILIASTAESKMGSSLSPDLPMRLVLPMKTIGLCLLKSRLLLRQLMLRPPMDTLLGDAVGASSLSS